MSITNIKSVNPNTTTAPTKPTVQTNHTQNTQNTTATNQTNNVGTTRQTQTSDSTQMMQQHTQVRNNGNVGMSPMGMFNLFKQRRLGDRSLSNVDGGHSGGVPAMHPDEMEAVFGLLNGIKTAKQVNVYTKKLFKRIGQAKNIIDSNYEPETEDEKIELKNVKRKTSNKVTKDDVKEALDDILDKSSNPTNAYILLESAKRELNLVGDKAKDPKTYTDMDKAILELSKENYVAHDGRIRANVNIANESSRAKDQTQFQELYYAVTQDPSMHKLLDIHNVCSHAEFMQLTNLMAQAAQSDRDGEKRNRLPTSCPHTIHDVIRVMDKRSKIDSLYHAKERLKKAFSSFIGVLNGGAKPKAQTGGDLIQHDIVQAIKPR